MAYTKRSDAELLRAALAGYQYQYTVLGERIAELTRELCGKAGQAVAGSAKPKRTMSDAGRARIAAGARKRWAEVRASTGPPPAPKKKHTMSAEGRKAVAEATRKRWEAFRAAKAARAQ